MSNIPVISKKSFDSCLLSYCKIYFHQVNTESITYSMTSLSFTNFFSTRHLASIRKYMETAQLLWENKLHCNLFIFVITANDVSVSTFPWGESAFFLGKYGRIDLWWIISQWYCSQLLKIFNIKKTAIAINAKKGISVESRAPIFRMLPQLQLRRAPQHWKLNLRQTKSGKGAP